MSLDDLATTPPLEERSDRWAEWRHSVEPSEPAEGVADSAYRGGALRQLVRRFVRQRAAMGALVLLVVLVGLAVAAPVLVTHDPDATSFSESLVQPSGDHWLGTDQLGRDTFSRLIYAGRVSLLAAVQALSIALAIGVPLGVVAGYFRGRTDAVISAITDGVMAMPGLLLAVAILGAMGPGLTNAMLAIGVLFAPRFIRLLRASVISIREDAYIEAAITSGTPSARILIRHVLPKALPPLLVQAAFTTGFAMLAEASLSFLGLGVQAPQASWGSMLKNAYGTINQSSFQPLPAGFAIALSVLAFNMVGDGLRNAIGREEHR